MCKLSVNCIGDIATNDRVFSELLIGKNVKETGCGLCGSCSRPTFMWRDTTRLGVGSGLGTGALRIQNRNTEHPTATFRLHSWHTGLFEQQLETRTWLCMLTEVEMSACWSRGSVPQWHQPALSNNINFHLYLIRILLSGHYPKPVEPTQCHPKWYSSCRICK